MKKLVLIITFITASAAVNAQEVASGESKSVVHVSNAKGITISKQKLVADATLHLSKDYKQYKITSYQLSYVPNGKGNEVFGPFVINGDKMTGRAAEILNRVQPGDRIFFEDILVEPKDGGSESFKTQTAIKIE